MPLLKAAGEAHAGGVRFTESRRTSRLRRSRPAGDPDAPSTILYYSRRDRERLVVRRWSHADRCLAKVLAGGLDRRLAIGHAPEDSRLLAARAQHLVSDRHRKVVTRDWEHVLELVAGPRASRHACSPRIRLRHAEVLAAMPAVEEMLALLAPGTAVSARGVAAAGGLLSDAASPLYNPRARLELSEAVRQTTRQLHPASSLRGAS